MEDVDKLLSLGGNIACYDNAAAVSETQRKNAMDALACLALSASGCQYLWHGEKVDRICNPLTKLGTEQDCEDTAVAVCCFWRWLSTCVDKPVGGNGLALQLYDHLRTVVRDVVLVAGFVDVEVAQPGVESKDTISGHAWVALRTKEGHSFFVETTNFAYPHSGQSAKALYGEMLCEGKAGSEALPYDAPQLQQLWRYKTVDVMFTEDNGYLVLAGENTVGVTAEDFIKGKYDSCPIASIELQARASKLWTNFDARPSEEDVIRLAQAVKHTKGDNSTSTVGAAPGQSFLMPPGSKGMVGLRFPLSTVVVVGAKWSTAR